MLSLARDLVKVKSRDNEDIKPLTVSFWSDFMSNPSVMYGLFSATPRKLNYDPDKVKVMGTKDGMIKYVYLTLKTQHYLNLLTSSTLFSYNLF